MNTEPTELDGYKAAEIIVKQLLDAAEKDRPKRIKDGYAKRADYRAGYYQGLLAAHCFTALSSHPNHPENKKQIINTLKNG